MKAWRQKTNQDKHRAALRAANPNRPIGGRMGRALRDSGVRIKATPSTLFFRMMFHAGLMEQA